MTDVERIAASLTKAQREVLLDVWPVSDTFTDACVLMDSGELCDQLEDLGLIEWDGPLTPLGQCVATHLKENENAG